MKADKKKSGIINRISRSLNYIDFSTAETKTVSDAYVYSYIRNFGKLLKKLEFLTHPDTSPNYNFLSHTSSKEIDKIFFYTRAMKSDFDKSRSYSPGMLLYNLPDYDKLRSIYFKVCEILNIDPEKFEIGDRLEIMIALGTPYNGIIEFLKRETDSLITKISHFPDTNL
jgi:hypothetical protein